MMTSCSNGTSTIFDTFIDGLLDSWNSNPNIPNTVKKKGPIILIDSAPIHSKLRKGVTFKRLPKYSPFLNLAEPINRLHKFNVRKIYRYKLSVGELEKLEIAKRGTKIASKWQFIERITHLAWKLIGNEMPAKYFNYIIETYFLNCLNLIPIEN
jgi:hypothetical protein